MKAVDEDVTMRKPVHMPADEAQAQGRTTHAVSNGDQFLSLLNQPQMAAAADEGVVVGLSSHNPMCLRQTIMKSL